MAIDGLMVNVPSIVPCIVPIEGRNKNGEKLKQSFIFLLYI